PEHDGTASGQQEIFFVHEGEAVATLDGEEVRAPAGTFVAVEPGTRRKFEAAVSPTTVVVVGSCPGKAYEVGPWEQSRVDADAAEIRGLGCLLERQRTPPDPYPPALNSPGR